MARRPVDIIIPVYKGFETTKACIESVLASKNTLEAHVYVINDASPEYEINAYLTWLSGNAPVTVVNNTCNLGFTRTVNKGFALNPDHDVILLNSDTLVYSDWADRMARTANSSHDIGTVTPFSNNATICSYPFINKDNSLPTKISPAELDGIFKRVNAGGVCDLPTGVGFCMYFKRECLDDVGYFDEEAFGRGYGEENDFCLRAHSQGWRNLLAADVYVPHLGGCSFGTTRKSQLSRNLAVLNRRHDGYKESIQAFLLNDPVLGFRRKVDEHIIEKKANRPLILQICHKLGGGTAKRLKDENEELVAQGYRVASLYSPHGKNNSVVLEFDEYKECPNLKYNATSELESLLYILSHISILSIQLHHFIGFERTIIDILQAINAPYSVIVHDYAWYCPRINLINHTGKYCGEPNTKQCQHCTDQHHDNVANCTNVESLVKRSSEILHNSTMVITPCEDTADRIRKRFDLKNVTVIPHYENIYFSNNKKNKWDNKNNIRVAVIGAIGRHKGYDILLECSKDAAARNLPLEFCVIGTTSNDPELFATGKVFVTGTYSDQHVVDLINRNNCNLSIFLSPWPETWCYTLSISMKASLPPLTLDIGATKERITKYGIGDVIRNTKGYSDINDKIIRYAKEKLKSPQPEPKEANL